MYTCLGLRVEEEGNAFSKEELIKSLEDGDRDKVVQLLEWNKDGWLFRYVKGSVLRRNLKEWSRTGKSPLWRELEQTK